MLHGSRVSSKFISFLIKIYVSCIFISRHLCYFHTNVINRFMFVLEFAKQQKALVKYGRSSANFQSWKSWTVNSNSELSSDSFGGIEHVILLFCLSSVICEVEIALFTWAHCSSLYLLDDFTKEILHMNLNVCQQS